MQTEWMHHCPVRDLCGPQTDDDCLSHVEVKPQMISMAFLRRKCFCAHTFLSRRHACPTTFRIDAFRYSSQERTKIDTFTRQWISWTRYRINIKSKKKTLFTFICDTHLWEVLWPPIWGHNSIKTCLSLSLFLSLSLCLSLFLSPSPTVPTA